MEFCQSGNVGTLRMIALKHTRLNRKIFQEKWIALKKQNPRLHSTDLMKLQIIIIHRYAFVTYWLPTLRPISLIFLPEIGTKAQKSRPNLLYQVRDGDSAANTRTTGGIPLLRFHVRRWISTDFFRPHCQTGRMARQLIGQFGRVVLLTCRALVSCVLRVWSLLTLRKPNLVSSLSPQSSSAGGLLQFCSKIGSDISHYMFAVRNSCKTLQLRLLDQNGNVLENCSELILDVEYKIRNAVKNVADRILVLISPDRYYGKYQHVWSQLIMYLPTTKSVCAFKSRKNVASEGSVLWWQM